MSHLERFQTMSDEDLAALSEDEISALSASDRKLLAYVELSRDTERLEMIKASTRAAVASGIL